MFFCFFLSDRFLRYICESLQRNLNQNTLKTIGHHVSKNQDNGHEIERSGYPVALAEVQQKTDKQGNTLLKK